MLAEFGTQLPADVTIRVHDSTADCRQVSLQDTISCSSACSGTQAWNMVACMQQAALLLMFLQMQKDLSCALHTPTSLLDNGLETALLSTVQQHSKTTT